MNLKINSWLYGLQQTFDSWNWNTIVLLISIILSTTAILWSFNMHAIVAYGDAGAHLNIAKRVVDGLTPGFAQLGGVWLPLPHLLMLPFIWSDFMWRTGLAGSLVSGIMYVVASFTMFKLVKLLTKSNFVSVIGFLAFALNPNILYLQSTPMTELPLFAFFLLATYFFIKYLKDNNNYIALVFAAVFTFCASLSRYDAWLLIPAEGLALLLQYALRQATWKKTEARIVLFGVLAIFGVIIWLGWCWLILGDPLYFINSPFSAKSQQAGWASTGQLPTYGHLILSAWYYTVATAANNGYISSALAVIGMIFMVFSKDKNKFFYLLILLVPFFFNIYALFSGDSILFIPGIEPVHIIRPLFNARYGAAMISTVAVLISYLIYKLDWIGRGLVILLLGLQLGMFFTGNAEVVTYTDAVYGQSTGIKPGSTSWAWINQNYDGGKVLLDDYTTIFNVAKTNIEMQNVVSIGEKPYWSEAFSNPQKIVRWVIVEPGDAVATGFANNYQGNLNLQQYFTPVYQTQNFVIYKRNDTVATTQ